MNPTSHRPELDLLRRQVADLARELAERDRVLHERTRHLQVAQTLAHLGSWSWEIASGEVEWSDELYRIFGYAPRSREMTFDSFVSAVLPDDHDRVLASIDDALAGTAPYDMECRIVRPDGEVRTIHCCGEVVRESSGQPLRMSATALDITDRKETELALQQREAHFRALIEHSSDVITVLNLDGIIRFESPSVERLLGYAQYELHGRSAFEFVHHEDLPAVTEKFQLLVERPGTPQVAEFRFRHKDGSWRNFEGIGRVIRDPDGRCSVIVNSRDITERKRTEAMLRASQEQLRQALHASGTGLWDWNTDTNEVVLSEEWKHQLGYESEEISDSFEAWTTRLHPEDREAAIAYVRDYVSSREGDYRQEFRLRHKDGTYRWIEARASLVTEADGRRIRLLGSHTDITDRKQMEAAVRESEERYRTLVELSPSGVFVFSDGRAAYVNHTAAALLGARNPQEILDRPTFEFIHSDYHQEVRENVKRLLSGAVSVNSAERIYLKMDGTPVPVQVETARITWNGQPAIFGLFSDITERKQAEEALRQSEERWQLAATGTTDGIWDWNVAEHTVFLSGRWKQVRGYREEEIGVDETEWSSRIHPEDSSRVMATVQSYFNKEIPLFDCEYRTRRKDGTYYWVSDRGIAVWDEQGRVVRMVGSETDITERKQAEQALRESEERFSKAFRTSLHPIGITEVTTGRCIEVNDACLELFGFRREEVIGSTTLMLGIWPNEADRARLVKRLKAGEPVRNLESSIKTKSGDLRHIFVSSDLAELNGTLCLITVGSDITERKEAEQALWKSRQAIRALHDISSAQGQSFKERVEALLQLGCRFFDLPIGMETFIRGEELEVGQVKGTGMAFHPGMRLSLSKTYFSEALRESGPVCFAHAGASPEWQQHPAYATLKLESYIGTAINGLERTYGILCFASVEPREKRFTDSERDFIQLMARWLGGELDRQSALDALRQSEERYRTLYDETPSMYFTVDRTGIIRSVNQYGARYLGYRVEDLVGKSVRALFVEDDRARVSAEMEAFFRHPEGVAQWEFRKVRSDGALLWVRELSRVLHNRDGDSLALIVCEDITERKQAEKALADLNATLERQVCERTQALRQSEERFRQFFDNAPNVTALKDHNGRYVYTNRQFDKVFRLSPGMAIGKTDEELFSPEQAAQFRSNDQQVLLNGCGQEFEELTQQEDGLHTSIVVKFPVTDASGHLSALGVIATDITERKRTQEQLRLIEEALRMAHDELERKVIERTAELQASEERYARATAMGKVGVWEMDIENNQYYYGEAHLKSLFGYAPDELSPEPYAWLKLVYPDDQPMALSHWEQMGDGTVHMCHFELRMVKKDGSIVWIDVRCNSVRDPNGRLTRLIGAAVDITDRKRIEEALRDSEERFAKAFRTSPNPIGITEMATGRCIEVNDACLSLFGFRREEVIGHTTLMLGIWPNLEDRVQVIERLKAGLPVRNMEFALKTKSGQLRYLLTSADLAELNGTVCIVTVANDITDRKQAEEALRASEERFAKAFRASPHPIVITELDSGRVVDANDAAYQLYGYRKEEVAGQTTLQVGLWPLAEERARFVERLKSFGSVRDMEVTLRSGDGEIRQILLSSELIELNGKQCCVTVGEDVTKSRRMERALRRTQFSVDHAVEAILWVDPTARIFNVNDTACRMLECSRQDLMAMTVHDIDPNFPVERWADHWEFLKQQGALTFEATYWSRTGAVLETEVTFNYLQYEGKEYGCMILRDVGERKRAEAELRRSHTFLRQVIDTDPDLIFAKDREGRFAMANKAVADWYGTTVDDLIGKSDADFNANAEEVEFFRRSDLEVINSGRDQFIPEERITDAGGRTRWLQTVKRPIFDDQGRVHLVLGAATDITERKRMEEILLQRERDLSTALEERERISQDLHDGILQSLYAVGLGLEVCKPLIKKQPDRVAEKLMATLDHAIGQLNQIMTEVRNFIAGLESHVMQGGDFPTALRTMVETMAISSSARCRVRIDDAAARRLSTEQALHIINIVREGVSNALRHSRATQITVSLRDLIRSDRLAVTDDGIGFNTSSVQGVGHGLVNMAARAQKVRGLFAIQSKPDKGTRISLDLPKDTQYAHN